MNRATRNGLGLLSGLLLVSLFAFSVNTFAAPLDIETIERVSLETNHVLVTSTLGLAFCLGWVAGSFR